MMIRRWLASPEPKLPKPDDLTTTPLLFVDPSSPSFNRTKTKTNNKHKNTTPTSLATLALTRSPPKSDTSTVVDPALPPYPAATATTTSRTSDSKHNRKPNGVVDLAGRLVSILVLLMTTAAVVNIVSVTPPFVKVNNIKKNVQQQQHRRPGQDADYILHLIGERHSGTKWMTQHLKECFATNHDDDDDDHKDRNNDGGDKQQDENIPRIQVVARYKSFKHWFQLSSMDEFMSTTDAQQQEQPSPPAKHILVALFRNPLDWVEAMRTKPYHSPLHCCNLPWHEFVTKPWTMPRYDQDLAFVNVTQQTSPKNVWCRRQGRRRDDDRNDEESDANTTTVYRFLEYQPYQVIPCLADARGFSSSLALSSSLQRHGKPKKFRKVQALYELRPDGSGLPMSNILELRAQKIQNFLSLANDPNVESFHAIQYESLVQQGTASLLQQLEQALHTPAKCQSVAPQGQVTANTTTMVKTTTTNGLKPNRRRRRRRRPLSKEYVEYMKYHVDWKTEALVGYQYNNDVVVVDDAEEEDNKEKPIHPFNQQMALVQKESSILQ